MANNEPLTKQIGLTRGKAALIAFLTVALVGVVYMQLASSSTDDAAAEVAPPPPRRPALSRAARKAAFEAAQDLRNSQDAEAAAAEFDQSKWRSPPLASVIGHDPFALPAAFPQPEVTLAGGQSIEGGSEELAAATARQLADELERLQTELDQLKQRGVHVIIKNDNQYVAMIGDRVVHVGDDINGFTVTAIDPAGVRVERKGLQ